MSAAILIAASALCEVDAEIPKMISYQGKLTNSSGQPVTGDKYKFEFKLYNYDFSVDNATWTETQDNVTVTNGLYNVLLGTKQSLDLNFDAPYWLEIIVDGEKMSPRQPFAASPYAMRSRIADVALISLGGSSAPTAENLLGGDKGFIPYQSSSNKTVFLLPGVSGQVLRTNGNNSAPSWMNQSDMSVAYADSAASAAVANALEAGTVDDYEGVRVGTATIALTLTGNKDYLNNVRVSSAVYALTIANSGDYQGVRVGTATVANTLASNLSGTYEGVRAGTATIALTLTGNKDYLNNVRVSSAVYALTIANSGDYQGVKVGTATVANTLASNFSGTYEGVRAGTATIALTLTGNKDYLNNVRVSSAVYAHTIADSGDYQGVKVGTATVAVNVAGGTKYAIPYQNEAGATTFLNASAGGYLQSHGSGTAPTWEIPNGTGDVSTGTDQTITGTKTFTSPIGCDGGFKSGSGVVVLLNADEEEVTGTTSGSNVKTYTVDGNSFSRVIVESEIGIEEAGANTVDVSFALKYDGVTVSTTTLRAQGNQAADSHKISGNIKYSQSFPAGGDVSVCPVVNTVSGTWFWIVKSMRVYGVY
jgi:phosphoheptose isomerase